MYINKDTNIYHTDNFTAINNEKVYVICRYGSGLGHIGRPILGFCNQQIYETTFEHRLANNPQTRFGFLVDVLDVNVLRYQNDNSKLLDIGYNFFDKYILTKMEKMNYNGFKQPIECGH